MLSRSLFSHVFCIITEISCAEWTIADERSQREILLILRHEWVWNGIKWGESKTHTQQIVIFTLNHHAQSILISVRLQKKNISMRTLLFHILWILFIYMMKFHTEIFLFSSTLLQFHFFCFCFLLLCNSLPVEKKKRREK